MMEAESRVTPGTYFFFNLGCPKNLVDAELVAARLEEAGFQESPTAAEASLLVVTTCAFIASAVEESIDEILRVGAAKRTGQLLAVLGCLVTREEASLRTLLPEVDLFCDVREMRRLPEKLAVLLAERPDARPMNPCGAFTARGARKQDGAPARKLFTPAHLAYLKIADGCSNRCSYCLIPSIRGDLESRSSGEIVAEAAALAAAGVKELTVVAQDTTAWASERARGESVYDLLARIADAARFEWIRLMYLHPAHADPGRLASLIKGGALCSYLDIPIQHASDAVLERMGRGYTKGDLAALFERLRTSIDDLVLRTTVMVGFPGETEGDFKELSDFLEEVSFDHVGVFVYSPEPGTRARRLRGRVPLEKAIERRDELLDIQMDISQERLAARLGCETKVLVDSALSPDERPEPSFAWAGRFYGQAYEVDGITYIRGTGLQRGSFVRARIVEAQAYDLIAEILPG